MVAIRIGLPLPILSRTVSLSRHYGLQKPVLQGSRSIKTF